MKPFSLRTMHRTFAISTAAVFLLFVGACAAVALSYGRLTVGDIPTREQAELLTRFNVMRFETAVKRVELRTGLPDADPGLPDPFRITGR